MYLFLDLNYLFKSLPVELVLEFPKITPSGFNIGIKTISTLNKILFTFPSNIQLTFKYTHIPSDH